MAVLLDYVKATSSQSFDQLPFTPVDGIILAQLAYCSFDLLPETSGELAQLAGQNVLTQGTWKPRQNAALLTALAASTRFQTVKWFNAVTQLDLEEEKQFSAVSFALPHQSYYLAFRGTRAAFVDWKEDFNMAYLQTIPSQKAALAYFQAAFQTHPGQYLLGGHSKGGTLATYAFIHAKAPLQQAVLAVYNADGPGLGEPLNSKLSAKVHKLVPQTSLVGTLFDPESAFKVVSSQAHGFEQHDVHSWQVQQNNFAYLPETDHLSQYMQKSIADWVQSMDDTTKQKCLDAAYHLITQTQAATFAELKTDWLQHSKILLSGLHDLPKDTHTQWRLALVQLILALRANLPKPQLPAFSLKKLWPL